MKKKIRLTKAEMQSGLSRVKWAEGLILQLPPGHDGRNSWLLNFGVGIVAETLRAVRKLKFEKKYQACERAK